MTIASSQNCIDIFHVIGLKYGACSSSLREKLFINEHEMQDFSKLTLYFIFYLYFSMKFTKKTLITNLDLMVITRCIFLWYV